MPTDAYGAGAAVGLATEGTYGTRQAPAVFLGGLASCSLKASRPLSKNASIVGTRSVHRRQPGRRSGAGQIGIEVDGSNFGLPFHYWNGNASGALTSAAITGRQATAPTVAAAAGGTLPDGVIGVACQAILSRTIDGGTYLRSLPVSASANVTLGSGDNTITVTFGNDPSGLTPPAGWTYWGTAVFRTAAGGSTYRLCKVVSGTGTGTTLNGSETYQDGTGGTDAIGPVPNSSTVYKHIFTRAFTPGSNPLPGFTASVLTDNDLAEAYIGSRMNTFELNVESDGDKPTMANFGLLSRDFDTFANFTPTPTHLAKFMNWQAVASVDGAQDETIESVQVQGTNGAELLGGLSGQPRYRDVGRGLREVNGQMTRAFSNHDFFTRLKGDCCSQKFNLNLYGAGQGIVLPTPTVCYCFDNGAGVIVSPFEYGMMVELFQCSVDGEAGAAVSGEGRLVETVKFAAEVDPTEGTELRVTLFNLTSSYS